MYLDEWAKQAKIGQPGVMSPGMRTFVRLYGPIVRLSYRPTLRGVENLPQGAYLLVANHSGALAMAEISALAECYSRQVGHDRPLAGFAHPFGFKFWPFSVLMRNLGAIPSAYEYGEKTLRGGTPVIVFPGGDHEAFRPVWQANRVDFAGRRGFLRLARGCGVPIVPMGIRGSHYTAPILWRSRWLLPKILWSGWVTGAKRIPLTLLGVLGTLAIFYFGSGLALWLQLLLTWLWLGSPMIAFPWIPWKIEMTIGAPIPPEELFPEGLDDDAQLAHGYARVQSAVQALVRPERAPASAAEPSAAEP